MRHIATFLLLLSPIVRSYGQHTELSLQASSGFFSYGGRSAVSQSYVIVSDTGPGFEVYGIYGKKSGVPYGLFFQLQRITEKQLVLGARLGFDRLSARSEIAGLPEPNRSFSRGKVVLSNEVLQLNPYLGYRLAVKNISVDITGGLNIGYILSSKYRVTTEPKVDYDNPGDNSRFNTKFDFGPTAGISVAYKKVGLNAAYCFGLINYQRNMDGGEYRVYSRHLRLGLFYRIF